MNAKQKYFFDLTGYLHLKNVLTTDELSNAQAAINRLLKMSSDKLPPGIGRDNGNGDTSLSKNRAPDQYHD